MWNKNSHVKPFSLLMHKPLCCVCVCCGLSDILNLFFFCCNKVNFFFNVRHHCLNSFSLFKQAGVKGTLGRLVGAFEVTFAPSSSVFTWYVNEGEINFSLCFFLLPLQNQERKHRTYVYVLVVTEVLEDWEDSVNIGKPPVIHENGCLNILSFLSFLLRSGKKNVFLHWYRVIMSEHFVLSTGRKREWFKIEDAIQVLRCHKPVQATYFEALQESCLTSNGTPLDTIGGDLSPTYSINQSSVSGIR